MPKSTFFARIKSDILKLVSAIPEGSVCSYRSIGEHLDVVPRHVAYILSTLEPLEKMQYPWHRVVGDDGTLGKVKRAETGETQAECLTSEGIPVSGHSIKASLEHRFIPAANLKSGVAKQSRPEDAPVQETKKRKLGVA